jgi:D-aminopeptidase
VTIDLGDGIRTGVTAILPHSGNLYQDKVPAAVVVGNGFGKLAGSTQIEELGEIETPIVLTNTLAVDRAIDALIDYTLAQPGNEEVRSVNAVVGETNDGFLNDIRTRAVGPDHVLRAIYEASADPPAQGSVGAGRGTVAFGWKGGIGTSSRKLPDSLGGFTVGVLVQSNFGGILQILGAPVGQQLGQFYLKGQVSPTDPGTSGDGSIMIVVATDAPLSSRNLRRIARRSLSGLARTGSSMTNGSGDYIIAFSASEAVRRTEERRTQVSMIEDLPNDRLSPLFQSVIEATEEAIYNSLFTAEPVDGHRGSVEALPIEAVLEILGRPE